MILQWILQTFDSLPGCRDGLFDGLWTSKRLGYFPYGSATRAKIDDVDVYNARLVCATVTAKERVLLLQPDAQQHRAALLFATALIRCWRNIPTQITGTKRKILYFGTSIGIREQLGRVRVEGFNEKLSDIFAQADFRKNNQQPSRFATQDTSPSTLPHVITAYEPHDPSLLIRQQNPQCIAIDLDDSPNAPWLDALLQEASARNIPVIGWGQNPLSQGTTVFRKFGRVIVWAQRLNVPTELGSPFKPKWFSEVQPLILKGNEADNLSVALRDANRRMAEASTFGSGRLFSDALLQHWRYLRSLDSLCVPYNFYESEVPKFWGLKTFASLRKGCELFQKACQQVNARFAARLESAFAEMERARDLVTRAGPPLWSVLCNLCIEAAADGKSQMLVFSSQSRKQLFLLAMLAHYNISEADLLAVRTSVVALDELRRLYRRTAFSSSLLASDQSLAEPEIARAVMIGLPTRAIAPKLLPIFTHNIVEVLIYPHEISSLRQRSIEWNESLTTDLRSISEALVALKRSESSFELPKTEFSGYRPPKRLVIKDPLYIEVSSAERKTTSAAGTFWDPDDPVEEIARLFQSDIDNESDPGIIDETKDEAASQEEEWCETAIEIQFQNGTHILLAGDEKVNLVRGFQVEERYVRSLKAQDKIVLVSTQHRQNLYELIISRLHGHPSMMLHLSLIRRWQGDLVQAYEKWSRTGGSIEALLRQIIEKGSSITSTAAVRSWLQGLILCPLDEEDLKRLADTLFMDFVAQNYRSIGKAASRLRGLHRGFSNRINRWLEQQASGIESNSDDELIDEELDLTFGDLKSSLMLLTIRGVNTIRGPFLRSSLGKLEV
jgi:hypothetical protein